MDCQEVRKGTETVHQSALEDKQLALGQFAIVPHEMTQLIFSFLPEKTVYGTLTAVCRNWQQNVDAHENYGFLNKLFRNQPKKFGVESIRDNQYPACELLCQLACKGSSAAQKILLEMLDSTTLKLKHVEYFYQPAIQGDPWGLYCLGRILVTYEMDKGLEYLKLASEKGHLHAQFLYGKVTNDKKKWLASQGSTEAIEILEQAAACGLPDAQYECSRFSLEKNKRKQFLELAAEQKFSRALLAVFKVSSALSAKQFECLVQAATQSESCCYAKETACFELGSLSKAITTAQLELELESEENQIPPEVVAQLKRFHTFEYRTSAGILEDHFQFGWTHADADYIDPDRFFKYVNPIALYYSCNPNVVPFFLGLLFGLGVVFPQDEKKALDYMYEGIRQASPKNFWRPYGLKQGKILKREPGFSFLNETLLIKELVNFVREKAEKGISDYQFILGRFSLSKVRGTEEKEALNWFEKANAQGHSDSCYFIFRIYQLQKDEINMEKYLKKIEENSPILAYLLKEIHFPLSKRL